MPRLIHLNGPPGIGKSTLAQRFANDNPGVLNLDIDRLRGMIGGWFDHYAETGEMVRPLAVAMASTHLELGRDVVLPQYLGEVDEIEKFASAARRSGAEFREFFVMDSQAGSIARFGRRGQHDSDPWHEQVQQIVRRHGGPDLLATMHDQLTDLLRTRVEATLIPSLEGAVDETYATLVSALRT